MRSICLASLLLAACSQEAAAPGLPVGIYAGAGRSRLCIAGGVDGQRGGIIVYGANDQNCSVTGRLEPAATGFALVSKGEGDCRISLSLAGRTARISNVPAACSYYCARGASFGEQSFTLGANATPASDFAGDPLC